MPQIAFPHILTTPTVSNKGLFRVVQPKEIVSGDYVYDPYQSQFNSKTEQTEMTYLVYEVLSVDEKRKARGDWSNWECGVPFYHKTTAEYKGIFFLKGGVHVVEAKKPNS